MALQPSPATTDIAGMFWGRMVCSVPSRLYPSPTIIGGHVMGPATYYASARLKLAIGGSSPLLSPRTAGRADTQVFDMQAEANKLMEGLVRLWSRFVGYRRILEPSKKVLVGYLPESMFLDARPSG